MIKTSIIVENVTSIQRTYRVCTHYIPAAGRSGRKIHHRLLHARRSTKSAHALYTLHARDEGRGNSRRKEHVKTVSFLPYPLPHPGDRSLLHTRAHRLFHPLIYMYIYSVYRYIYVYNVTLDVALPRRRRIASEEYDAREGVSCDSDALL